MPDFTTYVPPGVFIEEDLSSTVNVVGNQPAVVAIVGPSVGYRTYTETAVLTGINGVVLTKNGVDPATVVISSAAGATYEVDTDYTLAVDGGADANVLTTPDNVVTLARVTTGDIQDGGLVYISYRYTDADYYNPFVVQDFDEIQEAFGPPLNLETGEVISPLSFAAKIAIENGARHLVCVPTASESNVVTRTELSDALGKLEAVSVNYVVPLPVGITGTQAAPGDTFNVGVDLKTHCTLMENEGLFRIGIIGWEADATVTPEDTVDHFRDRRIVAAFPNQMLYFHGFRNVTTTVAGYYLAAAYAGRLSSLIPSMPLTKKEIVGFSGIPSSILRTMTETQKNAWSEAGVAVTEVNRAGQMVVRHGVTTDRSSNQRRELSLVRARDALVDMIQRTMDTSGLIGGYIDEDTPTTILAVVSGILESAKASDVIVDYTALKIRQTQADPSVMEIRFAYKPAYPLNYIVFLFSIDTSVGETDFTDNTDALV